VVDDTIHSRAEEVAHLAQGVVRGGSDVSVHPGEIYCFQTVDLAVDNTTAVAWINHMYAGGSGPNDMLRLLADHMQDQTVLAVPVRTFQQPADGPSRRVPPQSNHVRAGFTLLELALVAL
jgi:hypothetical protein